MTKRRVRGPIHSESQNGPPMASLLGEAVEISLEQFPQARSSRSFGINRQKRLFTSFPWVPAMQSRDPGLSGS
jgi:hypothetical protein